MDYLADWQVVVAGIGADGAPAFLDPAPPFQRQIPGATEASWFWHTTEQPCVPTQVGAPPSAAPFPGPGGTRFGVTCFPPHTDGTLFRPSAPGGDSGTRVREGDDAGQHSTDTLDYDIVISGRVDISLPNGDRRTLGPGNCLVVAGVRHAWRNPYDEPCVFASVLIGATVDETAVGR